jgi:hypothetical protein
MVVRAVRHGCDLGPAPLKGCPVREVLEKPVKQIWALTAANGRLAISKGDEQAVTFGILNFAGFTEFEERVCQNIQGDGAVDVLFS